MEVSVEDKVASGYLRLYCKINDIDVPDAVCRICGSILDKEYKRRRAGRLCIKCCREMNRERARTYYYKKKVDNNC
jgi:hypothetical protein